MHCILALNWLKVAGGNAKQILPFSTGVIGQPLPVAKLTAALPQAIANLQIDHWEQAARAIMTTDTFPKGVRDRKSVV